MEVSGQLHAPATLGLKLKEKILKLMISYSTVRLQTDISFYHWSHKEHLNTDFTGHAGGGGGGRKNRNILKNYNN
jgi:hypothetical protein